MICFVIENDRKGLRNEGTAHFGCHDFSEVVFDLIYEYGRYSHMNMYSWRVYLSHTA